MTGRLTTVMFLLACVVTCWALAQETPDLASIQPATTSAPSEPLDPRTTTLPSYELPADAAADGKLEDWKGVPPSVSPEWFKENDKPICIKPTADFAPSLYLGRPKGTNDLMILVVVKDRCVFGDESAGWTFADNVELFLDFGRAARLAIDPDSFKRPEKYQNPKEMAQIGLLPRTPDKPGKMLHSKESSRKWKMTYASMPVSGGVAYEVRVDGQAVMDDLKLKAMPDTFGIDVSILSVDYPILLEAGAWKNHRGYTRIFGDYTCISSPVKFGGVAFKGLPAKGDVPPALTLASLAGSDINKALAASVELTPDRAGEVLYWAACNGVKLNKQAVLERMKGQPRVQELVGQAMLSPQQDPDARQAVAAAIQADPKASPLAIVCANLIQADLKTGDAATLAQRLEHEDATVAISAGKALAAVGTKQQAQAWRKAFDAKVASLTTSKKPKEREALLALRVFVQPSLELLEFRSDPPTMPKNVLRREVKQANVDLPRTMPLDNNHVYDGKLARTWPKQGPKELWRYKVGGGVTSVVEAGGKAYAMGWITSDKQETQQAYCFDAASGSLLWQKELSKGKANWGAAGPIADGDRVYFFPENGQTTCFKTDGTLLWRGDEKNQATRGPVFSCPLIVGDVLYLPGKTLTAINKLDGKVLWTSPTKKDEQRDTSPASPAYTEVDGVGVIIMGSGNGANAEVIGLDAKTGEVFFRKAIQIGFGLCSSPVIDGSRVYTSSGVPGQEFHVCYQLFVRDGKVQALPVYSRKDTQGNYANTPAVWQGAMYGVGAAGLECTDAATGNMLWSSKASGVHQGSHLIVADGLLLIQAGDSNMVLAEANSKEYRELGRFKVPLTVSAQQHTIANGRLYIRCEDSVIVYDIAAK